MYAVFVSPWRKLWLLVLDYSVNTEQGTITASFHKETIFTLSFSSSYFYRMMVTL